MDRIEKAVAKILAPRLAEHGFVLHLDWGSFVRRQSYGFDAFVVVNQGSASREYFAMEAYCQVRHDCIEVPWNAFGFIHGEENRQQTWTVMLSRRRNAPVLAVRPATMAVDVAAVAEQLQAYFNAQALPFHRQFASLGAVEAMANHLPMARPQQLEPLSVGGPTDHQAMRSLLLAKAVNPARYAAVREAFIDSPRKTLLPRERCLRMVDEIDTMPDGFASDRAPAVPAMAPGGYAPAGLAVPTRIRIDLP